MHFYRGADTEAQMAQADSIGREIISTARELSGSPDNARRILKKGMPEIVTDVQVERRKHLIITYDSGSGERSLVFRSKYPIASNLEGEYLDLLMEKTGDVIVLCSGMCSCEAEACANGEDDDCDGLTDSCDPECGTDNDSDYSTQECAYPDCDDSNASISPLLDDICNNGIDENCDGQDAVC